MPGFPPGARQPRAGASRPAAQEHDEEEDYVDEELEEPESPVEERPAPARRRPAPSAGRPGAPDEPPMPFGGPTPAADSGRGRGPSDLAADLYEEDTDARLYAGREILMEGGDEDVRELARAVGEWDSSDRQFIINIARTLDGWRPVLVLEALRNDEEEEVAIGAREALATVVERNEREEKERLAWEAARTPPDEEDEDDNYEERQVDEPQVDDDSQVDQEPPAAPEAPEAPEPPEVRNGPSDNAKPRGHSPRRGPRK
jgi:hypothetical protein